MVSAGQPGNQVDEASLELDLELAKDGGQLGEACARRWLQGQIEQILMCLRQG